MKSFILLLILITSTSLNVISKQHYPMYIPNSSKFNCGMCHTSQFGGGSRNSFGQTVDKNMKNDLPDWVEIFNIDSDADGFTNGQELQDPEGKWTSGDSNPGDINLVTKPGDKNDKPTSVEDDLVSSLISIFPNPTNNIININLNDLTINEILLFNMNGELVNTFINLAKNNSINLLNFDYKPLSSGMYIVEFRSKYGVHRKKILIN